MLSSASGCSATRHCCFEGVWLPRSSSALQMHGTETLRGLSLDPWLGGIPGGGNTEPDRLVSTSGGRRQVQSLSGGSCLDTEPERRAQSWRARRLRARGLVYVCEEQEAGAGDGGWGLGGEGAKREWVSLLEFDVCNSADYRMRWETCFLIKRHSLPLCRTEQEKHPSPLP